MSHRPRVNVISRIVIALLALSPLVAYAQSSYTDNFEGTALNQFWTAGGAAPSSSTDQNHTSGGFRSAKFASADGTGQAYLLHRFASTIKGDFSVWFYDVDPGQAATTQILSLDDFTTGNQVFVGKDPSDPDSCYHAQVANIHGTKLLLGPNGSCGTNSALSRTNIARTVGWHKFGINVAANTLSISIDGNAVFSTPGNFSFDTVSLFQFEASLSPSAISYWDDFSFSPPAQLR